MNLIKLIIFILLFIFSIIALKKHSKQYRNKYQLKFNKNSKYFSFDINKIRNKIKNKSQKIPKIIYLYWNDWKTCPEIVYINIQIIKKNNPDYLLILVDNTNVNKLIDLSNLNLNDKNLFTPPRFSDYVRIALIEKYGGVYVDASLIIWKKLNLIIGKNDKCIFFENKYNRNKNNLALESWFIAAEPNNEFIKEIKNELFSINNYKNLKLYIKKMKEEKIKFQKNTKLEYHIIYQIFNKVLQQNSKYKNNIKLIDAKYGYSIHPFQNLNKNIYSFINFSYFSSCIIAYRINQILDNQRKKPVLSKLTNIQRKLIAKV